MTKLNGEPRIIDTIARDLLAAGIEAGDCLVVHSSFKSLGLEGVTPSDVIATFAAVIGPEGTLMMPTFSYSFSGIYGVQPFHPEKTPGQGNGVLSETLRELPGPPEALRSSHPTYSVAALGKHARRVTCGKEKATPLGKGSSYNDAYELDAKVLLLGVGNNRNSMMHLAEVLAGLPYNRIPFREFWGRTALVERDGQVIEVAQAEEFCACSANFGVADDYLLQRGVTKRVTIAKAASQIMSAKAMVDAVVERLKREPAWLLCDSMVCEPCNRRKHLLHQLGRI